MQYSEIHGLDPNTAKKQELKHAFSSARDELIAARETIGRLLKQAPPPKLPLRGYSGHPDDTVHAGWVARHGISIPRADGIYETPDAWVRVKNGIIVGAGLKNQSILLHMISLGLLDHGAEYHGNLYKDWRAAFLSRLDPTKSGEPGGDNPDAWSKEDRYSKLVHRLDKDLLEAMDGIVATRPKARHLAAFLGKKGAPEEEVKKTQADVAAAFIQVANAMRDIDREAEEALERLQQTAKS